MKEFFSHIGNLITQIGRDFGILYRNFGHWTIMKILLFIYTIIITLVISLPFGLILFLFFFSSSLDWMGLLGSTMGGTLGLEALSSISENFLSFFIGLFLIILLGGVVFLGFSYYKILFHKLNLSYLKGERLPYFSKDYFLPQSFLTYILVSAWAGLYLLIPVGIFIVGFFVFLLTTGGVENLQFLIADVNNYFVIGTGLLAIVCGIFFFYLMYRIFFSFIVIVDSEIEAGKKSYDYVKESFAITKGWRKVVNFLLTAILLAIVLLPINILANTLDTTTDDIANYRVYSQLTEDYKEIYKKNTPYYYENLELTYGKYSDEELASKATLWNVYVILFNIFFLLAIFGLKEMYYISFYKRELLHRK